MTRDALSITLLSEETEGGRHVLFHPLALVVRLRKGRNASQLESSATISTRSGLELLILGRSGDLVLGSHQGGPVGLLVGDGNS